jgi:hypothetical protein
MAASREKVESRSTDMQRGASPIRHRRRRGDRGKQSVLVRSQATSLQRADHRSDFGLELDRRFEMKPVTPSTTTGEWAFRMATCRPRLNDFLNRAQQSLSFATKHHLHPIAGCSMRNQNRMVVPETRAFTLSGETIDGEQLRFSGKTPGGGPTQSSAPFPGSGSS